MNSHTIESLAHAAGATVLGDARVEVERICPLDSVVPRAIAPLLRPDALAKAGELPAAVIATAPLATLALAAGVRAAVVHDEPALVLARIIGVLYPAPTPPVGVHALAVVHPLARLAADAFVGPGAVLEEDVIVGEGAWIGPGVYLGPGTRVGRGARIGPGAVIGYEGFGYAPGPEGPVRIRHLGRVDIGDFVDIGANTCIDRATLGVTVIGPHTKLDNLVQVGHNARIGARVLIAGQTGLAGSTRVGDDAMLGGQVGLADHVEVGARAKVAGKSGVTSHVPSDAVVAGYPAWPQRRWQRAMARLSRLGRKEPRDD